MTHQPRKPFPDYGYRLDINDPMIRILYDRYRNKLGIPVWCPLSDQERHEFELAVLKAQEKQNKKAVRNNDKEH